MDGTEALWAWRIFLFPCSHSQQYKKTHPIFSRFFHCSYGKNILDSLGLEDNMVWTVSPSRNLWFSAFQLRVIALFKEAP